MRARVFRRRLIEELEQMNFSLLMIGNVLQERMPPPAPALGAAERPLEERERSAEAVDRTPRRFQGRPAVSASEKLRALDAAAPDTPWGYEEQSNTLLFVYAGNEVICGDMLPSRGTAPLVVALRNALPVIADVIEAAEKIERTTAAGEMRLRATLAALQAHLEES